MKKHSNYFRYLLTGILALVIAQSTAFAADGKSANGTLSLAQVVGGFILLMLVIMVPLIKRSGSSAMSRKKMM